MSEEKEVKPEADFLFEVSWEVCNKVGGIYTVIKSKIPQTLKRYGENYCLVGPYFHDKVKGEFEELILPEEYREGAEALKELGIVSHYGKWLTEGNPTTLLLDFKPFFAKKDEIKRELWERFGIDSLNSSYEFDEPVIWAWAVGVSIESFFRRYQPDMRMVALFHEWLSGAGALYLKARDVNVGTVFVTHATVTGRCLVGKDVDLYRHNEGERPLLETIDFEKACIEHNVKAKHQLEKAS
ncbi:alpha-glucan family phosphorylase, partial [Candidatus Woesearchaeota archaeon]|nr:alpha-glucan family phosphorylase [Candidatus Woesearchaeota archaeon]